MNSVKHLLDAVAISDTGSDDPTVDIIDKWISTNGLTGGVCKNKWVNFGHNRSEALRYAESIIKDIPGNWFILFMDADDLVIGNDGNIDNQTLIKLDKSKLDITKAVYYIGMKCGTLAYDRAWMIKYDINRPWKWFHPLHEYVGLESGTLLPTEIGRIDTGYMHATRDGARSQDSMKYMRDAVTLEGAMKDKAFNNKDFKPDPREMFYLAQSYRDSGIIHLLKNAEDLYLKRIELGGFPEEVYISYIEAGRCRQLRGKDDHKALEYFMRAYEMRPHRLEASYHMVKWFRLHNMFKMGYTFGRPLINLPYPKGDVLFVNEEIHIWRFLDEVAVCAFHAGDKKTCGAICERILKTNIDPIYRPRIEQNLKLSS
jgi:glycosyltransferase involved in cell wall biosynthesis